MFQSYLFPISYAFLAFPVAALLFTLPFLIVQYRRHGYIHKLRALILYLLLLYLLNALFLIMLPFPATRHNLPPTGGSLQLVPLQFIEEILHSSSFTADTPSTYLSLLKEPAFYQAVFNVLLTVPFGMFLGYYFRTRWVVCILLSFSLSLAFEMTQITGIYGFFDHPYRVFDVDDLITNTLGGIIGYRIALWISGLLPQIEQLDARENLNAKRVTFTRRTIAFLLDACVWMPAAGLLSLLPVPAPFWITLTAYFLLIPCLTKGRTPGKWVVRIAVQSKSDAPRLWRLTVRYGLLYGVLPGMNIILFDSVFAAALHQELAATARGIVLLADLLFLIHIIISVFRKKELFYERLSGTRNVILWPEKQPLTEPGLRPYTIE
ncbi:VanZ family protein [Paenibacillus sp. FSL R7-0331]|uniref:VanZ family protein n=1 Tax=Paenibacillus sp. FSL R7-0331 TaxID=1536773 RepID=UPI0004F711F2|nr:VanZ family protein [Paenibacillus sp. FSL R7-0331]AIQ52452.1 teicoplanin resistance protein VanZ [Paenibacillus sp. FSL R7-0331]